MKYFFLIAFILIATETFSQIDYPKARKTNQQDTYFGTVVKDPYRWMEDDNSEETRAWVEQENIVTEKYLASIPYRTLIRNKLKQYWNYARYGNPFKEGDYFYFYKNDGLQNQAVLYRLKRLNDIPEVFIDPNTLSKDGTVAMSNLEFSKNNKYAAYLQSQSGSDWQVAKVMNVATKQLLKDEIHYIKFSGLSWNGDDGFYYSRYPKPDEKDMLTNQNQFHSVYYHKIGTPQSKDILVFEDKENPLQNAGAGLSEEGRFLVLFLSRGTSGSEIRVRDLKAGQKDFTVIVPGFSGENDFIDSDGDHLLIRTNIDAPNYRIVSIDPKNPAKENWKTIVPEKGELLQSAGTGGGKLFLTYLKDASSRVYQANYKGQIEHEIQLPGIGSAFGFGGKQKDTEFFYSFSSFNTPNTIYRYDISTGKSSLFRKDEVKINTDNLVTEQLFFTSKDGTKVPMFITYKKGLKKDGNNPVLLYGYGGFNIPITPAFSISNAFFVEQGGIYASVTLRGGNEYGEAWHRAGMLQNKQNVFNDMISAAEFLIKENYTNKEKIAVRGGSNGGLLVGAVMTQRPDLFKVAIPQVGVMDMLRYHQFTIGWAWATEYGRSDNSEADFKNLYSYSPLHNLKKGVSYPATLVTTADHDDRVVPAHSFKFAATLQEDNAGPNPVLIRIETKAGHGAGKPTGKAIEEAADIWSFTMYNLGMQYWE
ncbi:MAG: S9 family peptidase [Chitinophagaceae bacterium]|nr:S9 family peptidase [Chitinophagaceae bacterium]